MISAPAPAELISSPTPPATQPAHAFDPLQHQPAQPAQLDQGQQLTQQPISEQPLGQLFQTQPQYYSAASPFPPPQFVPSPTIPHTPLSPIQQASANPSTQTSLLPRTSAPAATIEPAFKVQDLPEDPTSALTFTTPMVFAPALAELTPPPTPKMAPALSPATYILTKPQVQP
jgi:hypothetical protein